jgi:CheY-like chemotaxis protein
MSRAYTILVVDDERAVRRALHRWLSRAGHRVVEAATGEEALDVLSGVEADVVFLDLRLPGMSGRTVYHALAAQWPVLARRVVVMSGDLEDAGDREWLELHRLPTLSKPFELSHVDVALHALVADERRRLG